jgi:hypothetical protein
MSRCFGSSSKLSAKEYINKKRNYNMFCDLRKKFIANGYRATGTENACVNNNGIIVKFNSHQDHKNIKNGYGQFLSTSRLDLSSNVIGHQIKDHFCSPYGTNTLDENGNTDISNNYTTATPFLTLACGGDTAQTKIVDSSGTYVNRYAEVNTDTISGSELFPSGKKIITQFCGPDLPVGNGIVTQIVLASELPPPTISSLSIVFVLP